ncbi:MAG: NADH-quinone oxidoreductase subunit NuoE [Alphaproteobacteria bacterium]|nr:NADH-quinone oxidoreductase subunit NuoE [Alphaproteobacteria bacterium]
MSDIETFEFSEADKARCDEIVARYPDGRQQSGVIPLLDLAQRACGGWLPTAAIEHVADRLDMPNIRVLEVASFYSMFNLKPVGKNFVQLCRTTPCWLCGSDDLRQVAAEVTGCGLGETSGDGVFTVVEVECLGACCNAPMVQINDDYYEDLTADNFRTVLEALKRGETPDVGSQTGRTGSEPADGLTSLTGLGAD